jgi:UDP-N-acetylglucosamine 4,6-dehydratase
MKNKKIFITGGAGFLGKHIVKRYYDNNDITIFSRDEAKHYYLKKQFPKINCIVGDVRNYDLLKRVSKNHNIGIFAASLKQIESVDQNVEEALHVIIHGAINSRRISEENGFESSCFISSDKSRSATTLYGSMKFVAGESFIVNSDKNNINLSTAIYGNVLNSTGSIIPLIWNAIENKYSLKLYSSEMTRFMITVDEAIDLIEAGLKVNGYNVIPKVKSFKILDLFELYKELFGLQYTLDVPRISEKIHEIMISEEEKPRVLELGNYYYMHYKNTCINGVKFTNNEYSSKDVCITKEELNNVLKSFNYFK